MKQNADKFLKAHGVYTGMGLYEISVKNLEDFAKLVEQATLERAAKIAEMCDLHEGDYLRNSDPRKTIAHEVRADMYD